MHYKCAYMFGIGFFEFVIIFALCLIFFKPSEIITFMQKAFHQVQKVKDEIEVIKSDLITFEEKEVEKKQPSKEVEKEF